MDLRQLQKEVARWIERTPEGYWPPLANLARLVEETGELARALNIGYGSKTLKPGEPPPCLAEEMGDLLFTLLVLANQTGVDLEQALIATLDRYERRRQSGGGSRNTETPRFLP
ncbi:MULTISPECIES: nucleotide pyrophosphohydrolase [Limnochorda]|uniref:nucleotide pyrophosphohydrolase n=1 Tax=Limnochorda TaxID=1676651 RepID=UPI0018367732|nr:nucleotide pyrophosphohydrolase [Limnochorda pilosa]MBO2485446.1 nucleotide pyrophosphohydrolase [Bacillota bacterium]MBO2518959.1 nucleotide pyrophosphohydrolase [Bacillota bacterium]NMA71605.1 nucleotide pyrophosphohydrolase [Bacillota bacterium]